MDILFFSVRACYILNQYANVVFSVSWVYLLWHSFLYFLGWTLPANLIFCSSIFVFAADSYQKNCSPIVFSTPRVYSCENRVYKNPKLRLQIQSVNICTYSKGKRSEDKTDFSVLFGWGNVLKNPRSLGQYIEHISLGNPNLYRFQIQPKQRKALVLIADLANYSPVKKRFLKLCFHYDSISIY